MKTEDLRYYVLAHFPRWISKSPLYFDNIKAELPGFVEVLKEYFTENKINSFNMDWLLNMTSLSIRKKLKKMQEGKEEMEFSVWENKVIQTIKQASEEELKYYAVRMYLDLKDHPFVEIPKLEETNVPASIENNGWFKVGLKFADGTILYSKTRPSFVDITKNAGLNETLRAYVSTTYNDTDKTSDKNIFASKKKMQQLYDYCKKNDIPLSNWFVDKYNKLKQNE